MARIVTGVDRLVALINKDGRLTVSRAARELGVSQSVIEEWSDFLQDEGYITIEYNFSNKTLTKRQLSQDEIKRKHSDLHNRQSALINKAETLQMQMQREKQSFKELVKEFEAVKKGIDKEFPAVQKKLEKLKRLDRIQQDIDKTVDESLSGYSERLETTYGKVDSIDKRYDEMVLKVDELLKALDKRKSDLVSFQGLDEQIRQHEEYVRKIIDITKKQLRQDRGLQPEKEAVMALEGQAVSVREGIVAAVNEYLDRVERAERHFHLVEDQFSEKRQLLVSQDEKISAQSARLQQYYEGFTAMMRAKREELLALEAYFAAHNSSSDSPSDPSSILVQAAKLLVQRGYVDYGKTIYRLVRDDLIAQRVSQQDNKALYDEMLGLFSLLSNPRTPLTH